MSHLHPGVQLLLLSGLAIFWLIPLSSWLMLSGQRDRNANLWFSGTGFYALVATLFVFGSALPPLVSGPVTSTLVLVSVLLMRESLRREVSEDPPPLRLYVSLVMLLLTVLTTLQELDLFAKAGRGLHMALISLVELNLLWMANRVRQRHHSKSMWVVMAMFSAYVLSNISRIAELLMTHRYSLLLDFTPVSSVALMVNYLSVIFYCYGYWGFVVEKNRQRLVTATEQMVLARENERLALEREQLAKEILRERTQMMEHLATIGKLAQSGALSAAIAHEINQPLAAIQLNIEESQRLLGQNTDTANLQHLLTRIERDNQRAAAIVQRVRTMFSQRQVQLQSLKLDELVRFVLECMQRRLDLDRVQVSLELDTSAPFMFTAGEMEHILMNLLDNALDALQQMPAEQRRIQILSWREPGWVWLSVADNGPGVPATMGEKIFTLSETSKVRGMGVGLWLARYIVERHGGYIMLDEKHCPGARFLLQLPDC